MVCLETTRLEPRFSFSLLLWRYDCDGSAGNGSRMGFSLINIISMGEKKMAKKKNVTRLKPRPLSWGHGGRCRSGMENGGAVVRNSVFKVERCAPKFCPSQSVRRRRPGLYVLVFADLNAGDLMLKCYVITKFGDARCAVDVFNDLERFIYPDTYSAQYQLKGMLW